MQMLSIHNILRWRAVWFKDPFQEEPSLFACFEFLPASLKRLPAPVLGGAAQLLDPWGAFPSLLSLLF